MSKLVVVDDDTSIREILYQVFTKDGHDVVTFPRGDQALKNIESLNPDLVLMDIRMPGADGITLLKELKAAGKRIPVVLLSSHLTQEIEKDAYEAGAIEVIRKDIETPELRRKIEKILSAKHRIFGERNEESRKKILVVDDEEVIRQLLEGFFKQKGFTVSTAKDGEEALFMVKTKHPNVVLLDIAMPGMDGILTLKKIHAMNPEIGVVMATAIQDEEITKEATRLGAYAYVLKPFDLQYLELVVTTRLLIAA
ncbi:MAG: response regulator [Candidatus Omnitrophica bacterium]|nr:response regulator [Candidatus Omnitrophota bacterium]